MHSAATLLSSVHNTAQMLTCCCMQINFDGLHSSESGDQSSEAGKLYLDTRNAFEGERQRVLHLHSPVDMVVRQQFSAHPVSARM